MKVKGIDYNSRNRLDPVVRYQLVTKLRKLRRAQRRELDARHSRY